MLNNLDPGTRGAVTVIFSVVIGLVMLWGIGLVTYFWIMGLGIPSMLAVFVGALLGWVAQNLTNSRHEATVERVANGASMNVAKPVAEATARETVNQIMAQQQTGPERSTPGNSKRIEG